MKRLAPFVLTWILLAAYIGLQLWFPAERIIMPGPEGLLVVGSFIAVSFWIVAGVTMRCLHHNFY